MTYRVVELFSLGLFLVGIAALLSQQAGIRAARAQWLRSLGYESTAFYSLYVGGLGLRALTAHGHQSFGHVAYLDLALVALMASAILWGYSSRAIRRLILQLSTIVTGALSVLMLISF